MGVESIRVCVPAIILADLAGCTSRPDAELADARSALEAAGDAEAPLYAESEYRTSEQALPAAGEELRSQRMKPFSLVATTPVRSS